MPQKITSPANPLVKTLKSLHAKKGRNDTGLFLAEGARLASEAADLGIWPAILAVSGAALSRPAVGDLARRAEAAGARVIETSESVLGQIARRDNPQTVVGAYRQHLADLDALKPSRGALFVALEGVRDPGNLGTIIRTADAAGASGLILVDGACDSFSVEAVRASMGSIFALPVVRADFAAMNAWRAGLPLIGASLKGRLPPEAADAAQGAILLMGNEQSGLPAEMEAACDALVRLPMRGRADSLNLAAATAVLLYDFWRRQAYAGAK